MFILDMLGAATLSPCIFIYIYTYIHICVYIYISTSIPSLAISQMHDASFLAV